MVKIPKFGIFPSPLKDETCYSLLCRYAVRNGTITSNQLCLELFGHTEPLSGYVFRPFRMKDLERWFSKHDRKLMPDYGADHSAYPFYTFFLKPSDAERIRNCRKGSVLDSGQAKRISRECGFPKAHKRNLWYCPECVREDIRRYGETCWRRLPQMPGAIYCPTHGARFRESGVSFRETNYLLIPATYALIHIEEPEQENGTVYSERYIELSGDIAWLLENGFIKDADRYWIEDRHTRIFRRPLNDYSLDMAARSSCRNNRFEDYLVTRMMKDSGKEMLDASVSRQISTILSMRRTAGTTERFCTVK